MLIVGLTGSSDAAQQSVLLQLAHLFGSVGTVFRMPDVAVDQRMDILRKQFKPGQLRKQRLALSNIITPEEVSWLEERGGYLCHVDGRMSTKIRMTKSHYLITPNHTANRAFEPVEEVYSNILLHYQELARQRK